MRIRIDTGDARPIYLQIVDEVRRGVVLGHLKPDDGLPSVRQLAAELRVNPNTVQQAYRELEREGVAYVRRGQGTYVAGAVPPDREKRALAVKVAERALREAYRSGVAPSELVRTIEELAARDGAGGGGSSAVGRRRDGDVDNGKEGGA